MDIRIVIPCYNEPEIMMTIKSLWNCQREGFNIEIIVVVNSYEISSFEIKGYNRKTYNELNCFASQNNTFDFHLSSLLCENLPGHQTGAGQPRKIGMDLAVNRFYEESNPMGILVSLDADCLVEENYLAEIFYAFKKHRLKSATIEFRHPVKHLSIDNKIRMATEIYEEYLRYYRAALEYTGYPYAYYTIGSAFAVTAETYKQVGGMGKQQAGEDFYFLQKVFPLGKTKFIQSTCVYPAARVSDRVPFGTGPVVAKMIQENDLQKFTYQVNAFAELKLFFGKVCTFFDMTEERIKTECSALPKHLQSFLKQDDFISKIIEINQQTANYISFRKRFFSYFNAFKILKYLNYVHPSPYELQEVKEQFRILREKEYLSQS